MTSNFVLKIRKTSNKIPTIMEEDLPQDDFCNCGSIVFSGYYINDDEVMETNPQTKSLILSNFSSIFISNPSSITVKSLADIDLVQTSSSVFDLFCHKCKVGFRLILGRDHCYSCRLDDCTTATTKNKNHLLKRPLTSFFPLSLRRFIVEKPPEISAKPIPVAQSEYMPTFHIGNCLTEMDDDADFDLMFSSKQECIVGSFTDQWILSPEMTFG